MENVTALLASVIYVFGSLIVVVIFDNFSSRSKELSRKMLHILTGNWILISLMFTDILALALLPTMLLGLNLLSLRFSLVKAMERDDDSWGTVFYPLSILVLALAAFILEKPAISVTGILILAYGDGLAALVGGKWGRWRPFKIAPKKSFIGTLTVAIAGLVITAGAILIFQGKTAPTAAFIIALNTALLAALLELADKKGSDNLTLPLGTGLFVGGSLCFFDWVAQAVFFGVLVIIWALVFRK